MVNVFKCKSLLTSYFLGLYAEVSGFAFRLTSGSFSAAFHAASHAYHRSVRVCLMRCCVRRICQRPVSLETCFCDPSRVPKGRKVREYTPPILVLALLPLQSVVSAVGAHGFPLPCDFDPGNICTKVNGDLPMIFAAAPPLSTHDLEPC